MAAAEKRAPSVASSVGSSKRGDPTVQAMAIALHGEPTWWLFLPQEVSSTTPKWVEAKGWWLQRPSSFVQDSATAHLRPDEALFQRLAAKDKVLWDAILCWVTLRPVADDAKSRKLSERSAPAALYALSKGEELRLNGLYQQLLQAEQTARAAEVVAQAKVKVQKESQPAKDTEPDPAPPKAQTRSASRTKKGKRKGRGRGKGGLTQRRLQEAQKAQKVHNRRMVEEQAAPTFVMYASAQAKKRPKLYLLAQVPPVEPGQVSGYARCSRLGAESTVLAERNVFSPTSIVVTKYDVLTQRKGWAVAVEDWAVSPATLKLASGDVLRLYEVGDHEWLTKRRQLEELVKSGSKVPLVELPEPQEDPEVASVSTTASKRRHLTAAERLQREIDELSYLLAPSSSDDEAQNKHSSSDTETDEEEEDDEEEASNDSSEERWRARRKRQLASRSQSVASTASSSVPARKKPRAKPPAKSRAAKAQSAAPTAPVPSIPPPPTSTLVSVAHRVWVPAPAQPNPTLAAPIYSTAEDGAEMVTVQLPSDPPAYATLPRYLVDGRGPAPATKKGQLRPPAGDVSKVGDEGSSHAPPPDKVQDEFYSALLASVQVAQAALGAEVMPKAK